jgi:hypothetical protein
MNTKQIALIGLFAAVSVVLGLMFAPLMVVMVLIVGLSLTKRDAIIFGFVTGVLFWLLESQLFAVTNIILFPLMIVSLRLLEQPIFGRELKKGGLHKPKHRSFIYLGVSSFILVLLANTVAEILVGLSLGTVISYVLASVPVIVVGAAITSLLMGIVGIPLIQRLNKLLWMIE